jgi:hypothetical protein
MTEIRRRHNTDPADWLENLLERGLLRPQAGMLDREKVVAVLKRRFPGSAIGQVAAAANAIVGLEDEWLEVPVPQGGWDHACGEGCQLRRIASAGPIKLFRRENNRP